MRKSEYQMQMLTLCDLTKYDLSSGVRDNWWRKYRHFDLVTFVAAIDWITERQTFFPSHLEFRAALDAVMTAEEREIQAGIVFWKGWIAQGIVPRVGSVAEYAAIREALGLPAPSETERYRCERSILERDPDAIDGRHGPVFARLLGSERPALIAGSR